MEDKRRCLADEVTLPCTKDVLTDVRNGCKRRKRETYPHTRAGDEFVVYGFTGKKLVPKVFFHLEYFFYFFGWRNWLARGMEGYENRTASF